MSRLSVVLALAAAAAVARMDTASAQPTTGQATAQPARDVVLVDMKGAIGVGAGLLIRDALKTARARNASLLIVRLDTPGGLVSSTREIISEILAAQIPVAVYVAPNGARAASAGTYIAYSAHVAAMAPGTHLGAATPVQMGSPGMPGQSPSKPDKEQSEQNKSSAMERKVTNDAVAYLKSLAQLRGRNAQWAEAAVRDAATLTATEARDKKVIDFVASDISELLNKADGRTVETATGEVTLRTRNAVVTPFEANWQIRLINAVTNPNVAIILLAIGFYGIIFEFWSPGLTGPGVVGGISLIIALMALSALPVTYAGAALLLLGFALMVAEAFAPGLGILGIGGAIALAFGMAFLFDPAAADFGLAISWPVILSLTLTSLLFLSGLLGFVIRARHRKVVTGSEEMIGTHGQVISWSGSQGRIRAHGETWTAHAPYALAPGTPVVVKERTGLILTVEPIHKRSSL